MANRKKYSDKLANQIAELVAEGKYSITEICSLSGISRRSYYKWLDENAQMRLSIKRAEKILHVKELEQLTSESRKGLIQLIKGYEVTTLKQTTRHHQDGTTSTRWEFMEKHYSPDIAAILFVLKNHESKNFKTRAQRLVNARVKAINKDAERFGRILSANEIAAMVSSGVLSNLQEKSNGANE